MIRGHYVPIWFFIGILLVVYGALITGAGMWEIFDPPEVRHVLAELRPSLWWGGFLLALGGFYVWRYFPR